jgi:hypothetical protein
VAVPWATYLLYFHLNKLFKNVFCILELFGLGAVLATFQKIGQSFSKSSGHLDRDQYFDFFNVIYGRHDIQDNGTQHNDIQHNGIQY